MSIFYCAAHERFEDSDDVGYVVFQGKEYCSESAPARPGAVTEAPPVAWALYLDEQAKPNDVFLTEGEARYLAAPDDRVVPLYAHPHPAPAAASPAHLLVDGMVVTPGIISGLMKRNAELEAERERAAASPEPFPITDHAVHSQALWEEFFDKANGVLDGDKLLREVAALRAGRQAAASPEPGTAFEQRIADLVADAINAESPHDEALAMAAIVDLAAAPRADATACECPADAPCERARLAETARDIATQREEHFLAELNSRNRADATAGSQFARRSIPASGGYVCDERGVIPPDVVRTMAETDYNHEQAMNALASLIRSHEAMRDGLAGLRQQHVSNTNADAMAGGVTVTDDMVQAALVAYFLVNSGDITSRFRVALDAALRAAQPEVKEPNTGRYCIHCKATTRETCTCWPSTFNPAAQPDGGTHG